MCLRCQNKTLMQWYLEKFKEGHPVDAIVAGLMNPGGNDKTVIPFPKEEAEAIVAGWVKEYGTT